MKQEDKIRRKVEVECFVISDIIKNIWRIMAEDKGYVISQKRGYGRKWRSGERKYLSKKEYPIENIKGKDI